MKSCSSLCLGTPPPNKPVRGCRKSVIGPGPEQPPPQFPDGRRWLAVGIFLLAFGRALAGSEVRSVITFERDVRPILKTHCFPCHGEGEKLKGGVDLRLRRFMLTNSESGTVVVPGKPLESLLLKLVASGEMPKSEKKLTQDQVRRISRWIEEGAVTSRPEPLEVSKFFITEEERHFWSFQPVHKPIVPPTRNPTRVRKGLDAFLLARLEAVGLSFAPEADKPTLIRRLTLDLTGLPPTPEEVAAFLTDGGPNAYERLVDRLLASNRYGERWARHWLDVAGYADSNGGNEADSERGWIWRYRDYVIRSFNSDKPFDQFITEQLAGDELVTPPHRDLAGADLDTLTATGFLRLAPDPTGDGPPDADLARNQVIADTLQIVSSSLLGLTVQCAQCHDHRYDPIPQTDYYRLRAVFEPAFHWKQWKNPGERLVSLMQPQDREAAECVEVAARDIDGQATRLHDQLIENFVQKQLALVAEDLRDLVIAARRTPADKRTEAHKKLLREFPTFQDHIILGEVDKEGAKKVEEVRQTAVELRKLKPIDPHVDCLIESPGNNLETVLFNRGDFQQPRGKITPGGLTVLEGRAAGDIPLTNALLRTTGRRLAFARTLTDGSNPLTPRVLVNRMWHHLFGQGLVSSLGDFGALGERPSHPELLDWLASEFMSGGWRLKALHRLIVTSAAYRQSSVNAAAQAVDPDNRLLGRMRMRRLDAESLRDSLLALSGRLNPVSFGPPIPVAVNPQGQFVVGTQSRDVNGNPSGVGGLGGQEYRRSSYVQVRRSMPVGVMETFDAPTLTPNCEARPVSTVPPQALMLMNDSFVLSSAADLAERLRREHPQSIRDQLNRLWRLAYVRDPLDSEVRRSLDYLTAQTEILRATIAAGAEAKTDDKSKDKSKAPIPAADPSLQALASLCQAMFSSNRFLYLD